VQSFTWKYDKPANATRVPLTSEMGYETLISSVKKKKGDFMVHVFMKPPSKDVVSNYLISLNLINSHKHRDGPPETLARLQNHLTMMKSLLPRYRRGCLEKIKL
jgi:hypothetical protein